MTEAELRKWNHEYEEKGIPSSFRETPSQVLLWALNTLSFDPSNKNILDIGCGAGRNSLYLANAGAHVNGFDLSDVAIARAKEKLQANKLGSNVTFFTGSVIDDQLVAPQSQDMVIDMFVGFHIGKKEHRQKMHHYAAQTLKPGGFFIRGVCAYDDGYYGSLKTVETLKGHAKIVDDGKTGVTVVLYDTDMLFKEASVDFQLTAFYHHMHSNSMYGKIYNRSSYFAAFTKK